MSSENGTSRGRNADDFSLPPSWNNDDLGVFACDMVVERRTGQLCCSWRRSLKEFCMTIPRQGRGTNEELRRVFSRSSLTLRSSNWTVQKGLTDV